MLASTIADEQCLCDSIRFTTRGKIQMEKHGIEFVCYKHVIKCVTNVRWRHRMPINFQIDYFAHI